MKTATRCSSKCQIVDNIHYSVTQLCNLGNEISCRSLHFLIVLASGDLLLTRSLQLYLGVTRQYAEDGISAWFTDTKVKRDASNFEFLHRII
jgi:hypothetical protein